MLYKGRISYMENWKTRLAAAREHKQLSQEKLAKLSKVSQNTISSWEQTDISKKNHIDDPKAHLLAKVAKALGTTSDWILFGRGEMLASQSMGIDCSTLQSAIVSVKEALRARQLELDACATKTD